MGEGHLFSQVGIILEYGNLKMDLKLGFWVDLKSDPTDKYLWQIFHALN